MAITLPALNHPKNCQIKLRPVLDWSRKLPDSLLMTGHLTFSWCIVILVFPILRTLAITWPQRDNAIEGGLGRRLRSMAMLEGRL